MSRITQDTAKTLVSYVYGTITHYGYPFQNIPLFTIVYLAVLQPQNCRNNFGLGFSPFARHYLGNHYCFLFL